MPTDSQDKEILQSIYDNLDHLSAEDIFNMSKSLSEESKTQLLLNTKVLDKLEKLFVILIAVNLKADYRQKLLDSHDILDKFDGNFIAIIAEGLPDLYRLSLISKPEVLNKLNGHNIIQLLKGITSDNFKFLLDNPNVLDKFDKHDMVKISSGLSDDLFKLFLDKPEVLNKIDGNSIVEMADGLSSEAFTTLLNNPKILAKLNRKNIVDMAAILSNTDIKILLNNQQLLDKLEGYDIVEMAKFLPGNSLKTFLNKPGVLDKLDGIAIVEISKGLNAGYCQNLLTDLNVLNKLNQDDIAKIFHALPINLRSMLLENDVFLNKLQEFSPLFIYGMIKDSSSLKAKKLMAQLPIIGDFSKHYLDKICSYSEVAEAIMDLYENEKKSYCFHQIINSLECFPPDIKISSNKFTDMLIANLTYLNSTVNQIINSDIDLHSMTNDEWQKILQIILMETSNFGNDKLIQSLKINSKSDLDNFEKSRIGLCDEAFKKAKELSEMKDAYFHKIYGFSLEYADVLVRTYGTSLNDDKLQTEENKINIDFIKKINEILNLKDLEKLRQFYYSDVIIPPLEIFQLEINLKKMFSKNLADGTYKPNGEPKYVTYRMGDEEYQIPVYSPEIKETDKFKMMAHSTAAYGSMLMINNNYADSWNNNSDVRRHGVSFCYISQDNLALPPVRDNGVILGFTDWNDESFNASGPYDLWIHNDSVGVVADREFEFMSADEINNYTRCGTNEQNLERKQIIDGQETIILPQYVIIMSQMKEKQKLSAYKCACQMHIPIVELDKEKIADFEASLINQKIEKLSNTTDESSRLSILKDILLSHENNRNGYWENENKAVQFKSSKVVNLINDEIRRIIANYISTSDIQAYYQSSVQLMNILDNERSKFFQNNTDIDFDVDLMEKNIMVLFNCDTRKDFDEMFNKLEVAHLKFDSDEQSKEKSSSMGR